MITGFSGRVVLSWSSLYIGIIWLVAGMLATMLTERRGMYLAIVLPIVVAVVPAIFFVNPPIFNTPTFQFFRFGGDLSAYWNNAIIPFFGSILGALLGEFLFPSEEQE